MMGVVMPAVVVVGDAEGDAGGGPRSEFCGIEANGRSAWRLACGDAE
jgi:hypothetical protein